jgi:Fe-S oxidoreductase
MISETEYNEALTKVMEYISHVDAEPISTTSIGCRVALSEYGIEMQGKTKNKLKGTVIGWLRWCAPDDGLVTVKWDGVRKAAMMHCSQVKSIKN